MKKTSIGGQAVMEGVMMKSERNMALAVRKPNGEIEVISKKLTPWTQKSPVLSVPFVRGAVNLADTLVLGMRVLTDSAAIAGVDEEEPTRFEKWLAKKTGKSVMDVMMPVAVVLAVLLSIGLYIVLPALFARLFQTFLESGFVVNLLEGIVRMLILVGYLALISRMQDIRRLLGYHGAEHKTIACYEAGLALTPENARGMSRLHPRCGTSFLFLVMLISLFVFICFGTIESIWLRVLTRILMIPVVAAISYEALKALAKDKGKVSAWIKKPGLWMQNYTTREPDEDILAVAIAAFSRVLEMDEEDADALRTPPSDSDDAKACLDTAVCQADAGCADADISDIQMQDDAADVHPQQSASPQADATLPIQDKGE